MIASQGPSAPAVLGAFQPSSAGCFRSTYAVIAYLTEDVDGVDYDGGFETCPPDWEYYGKYSNTAVCGRLTPQIVVPLSHNTEGKDAEALGSEGLVCPPNWTFVGFADEVALCLSP